VIHEISTHDKYDVIIVPGGDKGSNAMANNLAVGNLLQQHHTNGKLVAAICAGYPECQKSLKEDYNVSPSKSRCSLSYIYIQAFMIFKKNPAIYFIFLDDEKSTCFYCEW